MSRLSLELHLITLISRSGAGDKFVLVRKRFTSKLSLVVADKHAYRGNLMLRF
jgi:hypothetical protein